VDSLWIVHDDGPVRAAVARLAGTAPAWSGGTGDPFVGAPPPDVVVMPVGLQGDAVSGIAGEIAATFPDAHWVLLRSGAVSEATLRERFAALRPEILRWPTPASALRRALSRPRTVAPGAAIASRRQRDGLVRRFTRAFGDLDLPSPIGNGGPLLLIGETGTGRLLMARVVHALSERASHFLHMAFEDGGDLSSLDRRLRTTAGQALTVCLDGPERLRPSAQRELRGWVELGPPQLAPGSHDLHWISLVDEEAADRLEPELETVLGGLSLRIPPLRERPGAAVRFAEDWLAEWAQVRGQEARRLAPDALAALGADAWPGNLRELEETLRHAVERSGDGALSAAALGFPDPAPAGKPPATQPSRPRPVSPSPVPRTDSTGADGSARETPKAVAPPVGPGPPSISRLARALGHELGNPMVSMRTFAQLLPERHDDPAFRDEFRFQVERDLDRVTERIALLRDFAELGPAETRPVDVSAVVEAVLDERRDIIGRRGLLVLRELEDVRPEALGDVERLRFAFSALLDAAFEAVADRADLYVACRYHPHGLGDAPAMRVLVRFHPERAPASLPGEEGELDLALLLAGYTIEALGGRLTVDATEAEERVLLVDLPAPEAAGE